MRASVFLLGMLLFMNTALAQDDGVPPSIELLEFLGEWGELDPVQIAQEIDDAAVLAGNSDTMTSEQTGEESNDDK